MVQMVLHLFEETAAEFKYIPPNMFVAITSKDAHGVRTRLESQ